MAELQIFDACRPSVQHAFHELQSVQNAAARLITRSRKCDHISPILFELHWLKIEFRIKFKVMLFVFKILIGQAPQYLESLISRYSPNRTLRSGTSDTVLLQRVDSHKGKHKTTVKYGWRAFSVVAPVLWNELPDCVREAKSIESFKSRLKTHYFRGQFS